MANLGTLRYGVKQSAGIDVAVEIANTMINDRYRQLVSRARWRMVELSLGVTVADQGRYAVPDDVVDLEGLRVGSMPYSPVGANQMVRLKWGELSVRAGSGVFSPAFDASGVESIELWPVPAVDGTEITGLAAMVPPALVNDTDVPQLPVDLHSRILDGAVADGLALVDERLAEADRFEARFEVGVELLMRRKHSRLSHGPVQVMVKGVHW